MKAMESDADNLRKFAATGDEGAFRAIVERHAAMVHGVAWRRLNDRSLAEDVTQHVFAILARKAASLVHEEIAGWLHRAAFIEARNACRKETRRRRTLSELSETMNDPSPNHEPDWRGVRQHIDELLGKLSSQDRQAVVLRFYEQRSYREISAAAGGTEESVRKRVDRALERLADLLKRRGVTAQGASLGALLGSHPLCPHRVSALHISSTAIKSAATGSFAIPLSLYLMTTSTKLTLAAAVLVLIAVPTAMVASHHHDEAGGAARPTAAAGSSPPPVAKSGAQRSGTSDNRRPRTAPPKAAAKNDDEETVDLSTFLSGDGYTRLMESQLKLDSATQLNKLVARLKLTPEQKKTLSDYYDRRNDAAAKALKEADDIGLDDHRMSDEDKAALVELEKKYGLDQGPDAILQTILTPEQYAQQTKVDAEQRTESASDAARKDLEDITKYVDLTGEERDKVFDALSQYRLSKSGGGLDLMPLVRGEAEVEEEMLGQVLTPEQLDTLHKGQEEESRQVGELLNQMHKDKGDDKSH